MAAAVRSSTAVFNDVLGLAGSDARWNTAAGVDIGNTLLTKDGVRGDRELLFLGNPANQAAKIITSSRLRLTENVADLLPDDLAEHVSETGGTAVFAPSASELEALCADHGYSWTRERTRGRLADAAENTPEVTVVVSQGSIDKTRLGIGHTKQAFGVSLFADVDGFTKHIEKASANDDLDTAVREFHVIRSEARNAAVADYDSLRVQYQGDRMQALVHLPSGDEPAVAEKAVRVAAALNSVFDHTLPPVIGDTGLALATGLAAGTVLVTKVGERGNRDVVSLGSSTAEAARIQEALDGGEIGIDSAGYQLLPGWLQNVFEWRPSPRAYVATDLTLSEIDLLKAAESRDRAKAILGAPALVTSRPRAAELPIKPYAR